MTTCSRPPIRPWPGFAGGPTWQRTTRTFSTAWPASIFLRFTQGARSMRRLSAPLRPEVPALRPGRKVPAGRRDPHVDTGPPLHPGHGRLERGLAGRHRHQRRKGDRPQWCLDDRRQVDPWSHFVNVFMLDRDGNRIDRRNPQDIFVPLYDNQIPPGAAQTVHYALDLPANLPGPVTVSVKLQYRKFDAKFMDFVAGSAKPGDLPIRGDAPGKPYRNDLPITTVAADEIVLPVEGRFERADNRPPDIPRVAAVERLRHWIAAQGEGRVASGGRGIFPGRKAGTLRRAVEPRTRLLCGRPSGRGG